MSLCFIRQALFWEMLNWRDNARDEMPFLACVINYIARNQTISGNLEPAKPVPAVTDVCRPQVLRWNRRRFGAQ